MSPKTALVLRATGSQGKGVVHHLSKTGWNVHALVSDPSADRALALKKFGDNVSLFKGALGDPASIEAAIKGADALFLNQMPSFTDDAETRDAQSVLDIAKATGIKHVVHSTQIALNDPDLFTKWTNPVINPAVLGKARVEQFVRDSGIPWTILRPGWFGTNILLPVVDYMVPGLSDAKFITSYESDMQMATVDPDDIGAFAAAAFNAPDKFAGKHISVVSEVLPIQDLIAEISRASGKEIEMHFRTTEETEALKDNPLVIGQTLTGALIDLVDMDEIKSYGIPLTSFREFLEKNKDAVVPK